MDLDDELCLCFHVSKRKVVNFVRQTRPRLPSQLSECFGAGTGCGWCIPFLVKIHQQAAAGATPADELSAEEYAALRRGYHRAVAQGECPRNTYEEAARALAGATGAPRPPPGPDAPAAAAGTADAGDAAPFDFTRYFSRSRPDPEPETLAEEPPGSGS
jgi:bacterioferritin-associated ferredoxin